jgi:acetyl-CoA carboxylase biotin carboxyl carrier protein
MELSELFQIIDKIGATDCQEAYVRYKDVVVSIRKSGAAPSFAALAAEKAEPAPPAAVPLPDRADEEASHIVSPVAGVYYEAPEPEAAPFISVGESFRRGQVLCIIESMKLMNEICAPEDGVLIGKLAVNGAMVESGQPIFRYRSL